MEEKQRTVDQLKDVPYTEMTEAEIESVIDFKAKALASESAYQEREQVRAAELQSVTARWADVAAKAESMLSDMREEARKRLDAACGVVEDDA